jgi:hypothetical protein
MAEEFAKHLYKGEGIQEEYEKTKAKKIERREMWEAIHQSPKNATAGPDGVNTQLLKAIGRSITDELCRIYDKIIEDEEHPKCWKEVIIVPIKKANKPTYTIPKEWRALHMISTLSETLERIIHTRIREKIDESLSPT